MFRVHALALIFVGWFCVWLCAPARLHFVHDSSTIEIVFGVIFPLTCVRRLQRRTCWVPPRVDADARSPQTAVQIRYRCVAAVGAGISRVHAAPNRLSVAGASRCCSFNAAHALNCRTVAPRQHTPDLALQAKASRAVSAALT